MASEDLLERISIAEQLIARDGDTEKYCDALYQYGKYVLENENDKEVGLATLEKARAATERFIHAQTGGTWEDLDFYCHEHSVTYKIMDLYYDILFTEAPHLLDAYCLYIEKNRPPQERFYMPRRKALKQIVDAIQELEDDKLDELFLHEPPRTGKSGLVTMATAWHCSRNTELSNLYVTYKEGLGGAFLDGVIEIWRDPTYIHSQVFPRTKIAASDAKNHKVDLHRPKKYKTLSGKGLESGLNGEYDASGWLIIDDPLEGIQDVLNPETLQRKQIIFDNNVMSRKKRKCKVINLGTIWSLHDLYSNRLNFLANNPKAKDIRYKVVKVPALDPITDESNFDYKYNLGFTTDDYQTLRAKFEENDDLASWYAQYQQEPIERDGAVFNSQTMHFYNGVLPNEEPLRVCAACDVALGGSDFLAFAIAYEYEDGSVYIPEVIFDASEKDVTKPKIVDAMIRHNVQSAYFEANQGGEGYKDEIDAELKKLGYKIRLVSQYAPSNKRKEQRIWDKAPSIRQFYFLDNGFRSVEYRKFMTNVFSFTINGKNVHDDAPDCLASLAYFIEGHWSMAKVSATKNPFKMGGMSNYYGEYY